ncbi:LysR family transcriptional regulator [Paenibacillus lentus]|uniref:LysR family transcriptional regulator n=1 Tax=Paenibacillus lentus TaxID=1338368 RepID=A0A3Q8SD96_9BACL|nr:LysR family transcriptional regulator [Paenibacillus lentus]AZK48001.1 LysR family transcriptional regulator [Paenibacillus lentus]
MNSLVRLETFLVLVECGSYTEAAKQLYCSQPTISNHIRQLEEQLETVLFHRNSKRLELTEQGQILLTYARQITKLADEAAAMVKKSTLQQDRILSVYVSNYISEYYFSKILASFHQRFPAQMLEIHTYCYNELRHFLMDGKSNFALLPLYLEDEQLHAEFDYIVLFEERFSLVIPPNHHWSSRKLLYPRDFDRQTILLPQSLYLCQYMKKQLAQHNIHIRYLQMSNFSTIKQSVRAGLGISFLPDAVIQAELEQAQLETIPVSGLQLKRKNGVILRKQQQLTEAEQAFCNEVQAFFHAKNSSPHYANEQAFSRARV